MTIKVHATTIDDNSKNVVEIELIKGVLVTLSPADAEQLGRILIIAGDAVMNGSYRTISFTADMGNVQK